ncbi:MAG: TIGR04282 family arsenosugar biosynthesis glycosyltransferase [Flavobacteriaceae bacterium]|nr:TIGR04282 family arsenosugar biosynthesis glycosyltransferase [Flavobacteriaceae bacterium]
MTKRLLIVFVKNNKLGKVKTRLAKSIGKQGASAIYRELVKITANCIAELTIKKHIYFSDEVIDEPIWKDAYKTIQVGNDLGERMKNAFKNSFDNGYEQVVLIGSDLPELSTKIIKNSFEELTKNSVVFGPAQDGGYYLIGLSKMNTKIFENKAWSTDTLLKDTLNELTKDQQKYSLLQGLNDIDTLEDLKKSDFYTKNKYIQEIAHQKI